MVVPGMVCQWWSYNMAGSLEWLVPKIVKGLIYYVV